MNPLAGPRLALNSALNLLGQGVPLLAALVAAPRLIAGLGTERFGLLTLAWLVIGYFSLFDLGLGRALTQVVASELGSAEHDRSARAPAVVWPALAIMLALGLVGGVLVGLASPWLVRSVFEIPRSLHTEALHSFYLLAAGIPVVVVTAGFQGILSAYQRFGILSAIRAPMGVFTFVSPLAALPFTNSLVPVTMILVAGRLLACIAHVAASWHMLPPLDPGRLRGGAGLGSLFRFGAWITLSNLISPILVYVDRLLVGATLSVAAVAYYATPYEMITKLLIVPGAILGVLFPAFATSHKASPAQLAALFLRGTKYIAVLTFPVILLTVAFAHEGLRWWLGQEFADNGTAVLQWLAVGVFVNGLAQVPFSLVQGVGRPDLTAKLHLIELPMYLASLWWALHHHGIVGAAVVWTARVSLDGLLLFWLSGRHLHIASALRSRMVPGVLLALTGLVLPLLFANVMIRAAAVMALLALLLVLTWRVLLVADERDFIRRLLRLPRGQASSEGTR